MLRTMKGSPDGIQVNEYEIGKKYDLPIILAKPWLERGWAEEDRVLDVPKETKKSKKKKK